MDFWEFKYRIKTKILKRLYSLIHRCKYKDIRPGENSNKGNIYFCKKCWKEFNLWGFEYIESNRDKRYKNRKCMCGRKVKFRYRKKFYAFSVSKKRK